MLRSVVSTRPKDAYIRSGAPRMDLTSLIETHLDLPRLSKDLDEIGHAARVWSVRRWTRLDMSTLFDAAKGFRALTLDHFVPASTPALVEVIHDGKNSLPAHTYFDKRFCRPKAVTGTERLYGYNHHSLSAFSGAGYFVAHPSPEGGEVAIDYTVVPDAAPPGWPRIAPSQAGFGRFVYGGMVDVMRGLSTHVSIGRATIDGRPVDRWFVLVRDDPRCPVPAS
jgi:hypothetical protein